MTVSNLTGIPDSLQLEQGGDANTNDISIETEGYVVLRIVV
ncbi:MAG: hypothetical protein ACTSR1_02720 [Candidatus Heimdallarchaeota archaeon]